LLRILFLAGIFTDAGFQANGNLEDRHTGGDFDQAFLRKSCSLEESQQIKRFNECTFLKSRENNKREG
jgi:hypothetical protein